MPIQKMTIFLCIITNNIIDFGNEYDMPGCVLTNIGKKIGTKRGPKHKITYYQTKQDIQVSKVHSWIVKLVFYLNQLDSSIFVTAVKTQGTIQRPKRAKICPKEGPKYKISYFEAKTGCQSVQNSQLGCKTGFLLKRGNHKHIFDHSYTLGTHKGQKRAKIRPKKGSKAQNCLL